MISDIVSELIEKGNEMLPFRPSDDCRFKAAKFLAICSVINEERRMIEAELLKYSSIEKATFAKVFNGVMAKTVQEKNMLTEASPEYLEAKENLGTVKNTINYLNTQLDVFKNAHLLYRQQIKEAHTNG